MSDDSEAELRRRLKSYADDIEAAVQGILYRTGDDNTVITGDLGEWMKEAGYPEEPWPVDLETYVCDQGNETWSYDVGDNLEILGGTVLLGYGGPNVWLHEDRIEGYWGNDHCTWYLSGDAKSALLEMFAERWTVKRAEWYEREKKKERGY